MDARRSPLPSYQDKLTVVGRRDRNGRDRRIRQVAVGDVHVKVLRHCLKQLNQLGEVMPQAIGLDLPAVRLPGIGEQPAGPGSLNPARLAA